MKKPELDFYSALEARTIVKRSNPKTPLCAIATNFCATVGARIEVRHCFHVIIHGPGTLWAVGQYCLAESTHPDGEVITLHDLATIKPYPKQTQLTLI